MLKLRQSSDGDMGERKGRGWNRAVNLASNWAVEMTSPEHRRRANMCHPTKKTNPALFSLLD